MDDYDKIQQTQSVDTATIAQTPTVQTSDIKETPTVSTAQISQTPVVHTIDIPNTPNIGTSSTQLSSVVPEQERPQENLAPTVVDPGGKPSHFNSRPLSTEGLNIPRGAKSVQPLSQFGSGGRQYVEFADGSKMDSAGNYFSDHAGPVVTANQFLTTAGNRFEQLARQVYGRLQSNNEYVKDGVNILDSNLQQLAEIISKDAPNDLARAEFNKRAAEYRYDMSRLAAEGQIQAGKQEFANEIDKQSHVLSSMAYHDPSTVNTLLDKAQYIADTARQRGLNPDSVQQSLRETRRKIQTSALNAVMEKDPRQVQALIDSGAYNELGGEALKQFSATADAATKKEFNFANKQLDDAMSKMKEGAYSNYHQLDLNKIPKEFREKAQQYNLYGQAAQRVKASNYDGIVSLANSSDPIQADVARAAKKLLDTNPYQYALDQRIIPEISIKTPADVDKQIQNIKTIETKFGVEVNNPLDKNQLQKAVSALKSKQPGVINQAMDLINSFGEYREKAIAQIAQHEPNVSIFARANTPEDRINILAGMGAGKVEGFVDPAVAVAKLNSDEKYGKYFMQGNPDSILPSYYAAKGLAATSGDLDFDKNIKTALGSISMKGGGRSVFGFSKSYETLPPVPKMSADEFKKNLDSFTNEDIAKFGNSKSRGLDGVEYNTLPHYADGTVVDFSKEKASSFQWTPYDDNNYVALMDGKPLMTADHRPFLVDLKKLFRKQQGN